MPVNFFQYDGKCIVLRLRIDAFLAVPSFCPWKCQEQINMVKKLEQLASREIV